MVFLEIETPKLIVIDHGHDIDDDPTRFRVTLTFDEQSDEKTVVTLRQLHPRKAHAKRGSGSAPSSSGTNVDTLAEHARAQSV